MFDVSHPRMRTTGAGVRNAHAPAILLIVFCDCTLKSRAVGWNAIDGEDEAASLACPLLPPVSLPQRHLRQSVEPRDAEGSRSEGHRHGQRPGERAFRNC